MYNYGILQGKDETTTSTIFSITNSKVVVLQRHSRSVMTICGVLTTEHTRVATLDERKSRAGPALSLHSSGNILVVHPKITY